MKIRFGFVSNSSTTIFIISKSDLDEEQLDYLEDNTYLSIGIDEVTGSCPDDFFFDDDIIPKEIVEWDCR